MNVATFQASCKDCNTRFDNPMLPPMAYGEFIAVGEKGTVFAYLSTLPNSGWDRVHELVKAFYAGRGKDFETDCFQWVIGKCLDPIDDQALSIVSGPVCPNCQGTNVTYADDVRTGMLDLRDASFSNFLALDDARQEQRIKGLLNEWFEQTSKQ